MNSLIKRMGNSLQVAWERIR